MVPTFLTDDQLRDAESAFRRLKELPLSLSGYLDFAISNYRAAKPAPPLPEAIKQYLAKREWDHSQGLLSAPQFKTIKDNMGVFGRHFSGSKLVEINGQALADFCQKGTRSLKTYNNRRGILSTFLKYAISQAWLINSPITEVPHYRIAHRRGSATTFSATQAKALMEDAEDYENATLVSYFALCLFAGIRPCIRPVKF